MRACELDEMRVSHGECMRLESPVIITKTSTIVHRDIKKTIKADRRSAKNITLLIHFIKHIF